jgi:hypothetical protein
LRLGLYRWGRRNLERLIEADHHGWVGHGLRHISGLGQQPEGRTITKGGDQKTPPGKATI